jgi:hypothetical protein
MIDILLTAIILAQWGVLMWVYQKHDEERKKLVNSIIAKNTQEVINLQVADKVKPEPILPMNPDLTPVDQLNDEDFDKFIMKGGENG